MFETVYISVELNCNFSLTGAVMQSDSHAKIKIGTSGERFQSGKGPNTP